MAKSRLPALTLVAGAVCLPAAADMPAPAGISACKACHGPQGVSINPTIPISPARSRFISKSS